MQSLMRWAHDSGGMHSIIEPDTSKNAPERFRWGTWVQQNQVLGRRLVGPAEQNRTSAQTLDSNSCGKHQQFKGILISVAR